MSRLPGEGPHPAIGNPLLGRYDEDPGRFRPQHYYVRIDVPIELDGIGRGSIKINNEPFCMTRLTHKIIGNTADPTTSGLYQDGMYAIEWRDDQHVYQNESAPADLMFGWNESGYVLELPFPVAFPGNKSVNIRITNLVARGPLTPESDTYPVGICLHGIMDMGEAQYRREG
jgi:hypothetical protein